MGKFRLWVYPASDYEIWFAGIPYVQQPKVSKTLKQWAEEEKADIVYNLAMFNMTHGQMADGSDWYGGTVQDVVGKGIRIGYGGAQKDYLKIDDKNFCNGYKTAIKDGKIQSGLSKTTASRNANGLTYDGHYFHVQSTNCSEVELAEYCSGFAKLLLLQDGGGSVGRWTKDEYWRAEGERAVPSVVCIRRKVANPKPVIIDPKLEFRGSSPSGGEQKNIDTVVLHHSAGSGSYKDVHKMHYDQVWWGIGYHFFIEQHSNVIFRGRPEKYVGSHAGSSNDYNKHSIGVCCQGNYEKEQMDPDQYNTLLWLVKEYLGPKYNPVILGHGQVAATACPGKNFPMDKLLADLKPKAEETPQKLYRVQVGAFAIRENAERLAKELKDKGYQVIIV